MKTLSAIKKDLEFNSGLSSLIEVLKNIAVSQYRSMEARTKIFEKLKGAIDSFLEIVDPSLMKHPFLVPGNKTQIIAAITSDSGLLGGLNKDVIDTALWELDQMPGKLVVVGEKGKAYSRESKMAFAAFPGIREEELEAQAVQLKDYLLQQFLEGAFGHLKIIYPKPVSFTVQKIETVSFLPFRLEGKEKKEKTPHLSEIILESAPADLVEYLVFLLMGQRISEIFIYSKLAEYAARFVHLESSSQQLKEMDKKLRLQYFRIRHELIDRNMRELFASRQIYAS